MPSEGQTAVICRGKHVAPGQFEHEPTRCERQELGKGLVKDKCPECGRLVSTVEVSHDD